MLWRSFSHNREFSRVKLYNSHVPTTPFQKIMLAASSAVSAIADPQQGSSVAVLGETTGQYFFSNLIFVRIL